MPFEIIDGRSFKGKDDQTYELNELTITQWEKYAGWLQYKSYRAALSAELSQTELDKILTRCVDDVIGINSHRVYHSFKDALNFHKLLELSCTTYRDKEFNKVVGLENAAILLDIILRLNIPDTKEDQEKNPTNPNQ